ncbi:MAG TPA: helix-turn-helix transcriptional regulator [Candidatus Kapabacteria bacterium]|nr:helix-turn-helix transcriptional regulator [Candidatus Kapabacteria bacterium]
MQRVIGNNIRFLRESSGHSQETLAEMAGVHRSYIGHIERGEGNLTISNLSKIAEALHVHPGILFFERVFEWESRN